MKERRKSRIHYGSDAVLLLSILFMMLFTAVDVARAEKLSLDGISEADLDGGNGIAEALQTSSAGDGGFPVARNIISDDVPEGGEFSSQVLHEETLEPQSAFGRPAETRGDRALQYSTTTYLYVGPSGSISLTPSTPPKQDSSDDLSWNTPEACEISGFESEPDIGPSDPGVDLVFIDIYTSPASPIGGQVATIYFRLKNQGSTSTNLDFVNKLYISGVGIWSGTNNGLAAGATYTWTISSITLSAGTYELTGIADSENDVAETNEANNEYSEDIVWEGPDLVFVDIWTDPEPPVGKQFVTITWQLKNQGTRNAVGQFVNHFYIDGIYYGSGTNNGLSAGDLFNWWAANVNLTAGWHQLSAFADIYSNIPETNEANNEKWERIKWNGPDLVFEDMWISVPQLTAGQPFSFTWRLRNLGEEDAVETFTNKFYVDGVHRWSGVNHGLGAGGAFHWFAVTWLRSGWHNITAVADANDDVGETCETNNSCKESYHAYKARWTVLVYIDADNNLEDYFLTHFTSMAQIGSSAHISLVVQMDRRPGYATRYGNWEDCKRFFVKPGTTPTPGNALQTLGEVNMGDDSTLIDFATWGIDRFEATRYLLNLADHGGSWVGCCWDDTSGGDRLDSKELKNALSSVKEALGRKLDVIWFDDCLMNSIEVATQIHPYVNYMAGSETVSWTSTWDYNPVIAALRNTPTISPQSLAVKITEVGTPRNSPGMRTQSISSIDLTKVADLLITVDSFSIKLKNQLYLYRTEIQTARGQCSWYEGPYGGQTQRLIDLYQFADKIKLYVPDATIDTLADSIMNKIGPIGGAIGKVVMKEEHSGSASFCHGLGIYFPQIYSTQYASSYTDGTEFTAETQWDEFLQWYYAVSKPCLVVRGGDNSIYYRVREEGAWTGWDSIPGATNVAPAAAVLANKLHIVVSGVGGGIYHGFKDLYSGTWSGWTVVPGATPSPPTLTAYGNTLYLLVRGMDNRIYMKRWEAGSWSATWDIFPTAQTADSPAAVCQNNRIHVVIKPLTGGLSYAYIDIPTWTYSPWSNIPGGTLSRPVLTTDDSYVYLVVRGNDDGIYYNIFKEGWLGWEGVPGQTGLGPGAACFEGKLNIVVRGTPSGLYQGKMEILSEIWLGWTAIPGDTPSEPAFARPT